MASADYYRAEAKRCRDLAGQSAEGSSVRERWRTIAAEYEMLAEALEGPSRFAPIQQQPMQQQQQQTKDEK